ncbi:hypothetical protein JL722_10530 [Aureococcus anophagefferens]|nr:hypothetical protein JL722_10530 [Aureococcus anophagefferens]
MASVSGLLHVRLRSASGCLAVPAASLTAKFRLLPWREEQTTSGAHADADGNATWADDDDGNLVVLAQLAATEKRRGCTSSSGAASSTSTSGPWARRRSTPRRSWRRRGAGRRFRYRSRPRDDAAVAAADAEFVAGTTTAPEALERTESQGSLNEGRRHQHLFRLTSYTRPTWCAVCGGLMVGIRHQGFQCESCLLDCHDHCQLRAHATHDCRLGTPVAPRDDGESAEAEEASPEAATPEKAVSRRPSASVDDIAEEKPRPSSGRTSPRARPTSPRGGYRNAVAAVARAKRAEDSGAVPYAASATPRFFDDAENAALRAGAAAGAAAFARGPGGLLGRFVVEPGPALRPRNARAGPVLHRDHAEPHPAGDGRRQRHLRAYADYETFMSWDEPLKTGAAFVAFVGCCVFVDAEYAAPCRCSPSPPSSRAPRAPRGRPRAGELDLAFRRADEEHLGGGAARYRPLAYVKVAVCAGRSVDAAARDEKRTEKPTPGDVYVVASFRHYRAAPAPQPPAVPRSNSRDAATRSPKKAREPESASSSPRHTKDEDDAFWRDAALFPGDVALDGDGAAKTTAATAPSRRTTTPADGGELRPWAEATGVLVFRVMRQHPIDRLLDSCLGSVEVPVASLVDDDGAAARSERRAGTTWSSRARDTPAAPNPDAGDARAVEAMQDPDAADPAAHRPAVARRRRRARRVAAAVDGRDRDEYLAWAQNALGRYLDVMESMKNLVNWTHPEKTGLIFVGVLVGAVLFCRIKTRWLALAFGLYEFTYRLLPSSASTVTCRFLNALKAVPNDRDLRACYGHRAALHAGASAFDRRRLVLHGRRLAWRSERDADAAGAPGAQLLLQGHSGLTAPAPTDGAGLPDDRRAHMLAVFGQASDGAPLRWALLCADERDREALGAAITRACDDKLD